MVDNFPGPYEVRLSYQTTSASIALDHTQRLNCDLTAVPTPGDDYSNINPKTRGGIATPDLAAAMEAWLALIAERFFTSTTFGTIELWSYVPLTYDATFISAYSPTIAAGLSVTVTNPMMQEVMTFRTQEGGIMRIQLMEGVIATNERSPYPTLNADIDAIFDFVKSSVNWVLARDTSYPFAALNHLGGQNEKLFRQRFR